MMVDYNDDDVARLAEMIRGTEPSTFDTCARRLLDQGVTLPPPPAHDMPPENDLVGWAIAIISNVDGDAPGDYPWPHQTQEWRTAARNWLDSIHPPPVVALEVDR